VNPKNIITLIIIVLTGAFLFTFVFPKFESTKTLRDKIFQRRNDTKTAEAKLETTRKTIIKFESISEQDKYLVDLALPREVDLPDIYVLVQSIIAKSGFIERDISVSLSGGGEGIYETAGQDSGGRGSRRGVVYIQQDEGKPTAINISFSVLGGYEAFKALLAEIEKSLRIFEIQTMGLSYTTSGDKEFEGFTFNISMQTHYKK